jgi:hypothetical protein
MAGDPSRTIPNEETQPFTYTDMYPTNHENPPRPFTYHQMFQVGMPRQDVNFGIEWANSEEI